MVDRRRSLALLVALGGALLSNSCAVKDAGAFDPPRTPAAVESRSTPTIAAMLSPTQPPAAVGTPVHLPTPAVTQAPARLPTPPAPALPDPTLPPKSEIRGMFGYGQLFPLSCEARASADWARYFGVTIHELDFLQRLPRSKNPDIGFVGSLEGDWGRIPPEPYGVHAGPVAAVLRGYQAKAIAYHGMTIDRLRAEIAAGRPVIVWVTGHVEPGKGVAIQVDGQPVTVAHYEHTILAIGYDETSISFLDGKTTYQRPVGTFQKAWAPLGNMAIVWDENMVSLPDGRESGGAHSTK